ncbi:putative esterase/lipase family protein (plasmid) [Selenomonas ruminantium subsp. lactilytica TAM6421]|uniref:Putative esterase/lipase family protein n=1 Tax=Selenomonas ruminantium subsp. lactilytica (strain NBRC 103574 / TAM6421) TaxID=927704 RepID=I0GUW6_SELRL|nr:alpha/beta fold hydrolase [Selenomonas ruminantium]BAL84553.1 putative esterase/lipase family protein [Selenomonas ruminantium subsp. lactilytica TAM6421]
MLIEGAESFFLPGDGQKKAVLLVQGFAGNTAELWPMGKFLEAKGYTVLAPRLPGHGTKVEDLLRTNADDWLDAVRDGYSVLRGLAKDIVVIGGSMGGSLGLILSAEKQVKGVVTLAAPIFIAQEQGISALPPKEMLTSSDFTPENKRNLVNVPKAANLIYDKIPLLSVYDLLEVIERSKKCLPKITAPSLIVHGKDDTMAAVESAQYIGEHIGSSRKKVVLLDGAGHLLPLMEGREAVFEKISSFLDTL